MQQFIDFALRHWQLSSTFIAILIIFIGLELRDKLTGLRALSPQETTHLLNREEAIILDIRGHDLFSKGYISGSINIPFTEFNDKIRQLEKYKNKPIIIAYATGQSPAKIGATLKKNGFNQVSYLKGGITSWQSTGLPLIKA